MGGHHGLGQHGGERGADPGGVESLALAVSLLAVLSLVRGEVSDELEA
nr:hypothetical protein [Methylobacterium sp. C25]